MEAFSQMLWPLLACFVLVGIHAYLGIHVIARKVIFVDLALAQIAALGAVYAVLLGFSFESDGLLIKLIAVSFTLFGALLCSVTKSLDKKVPHEALIGIIYASALSLTFLLTSHLPHGREEVELMLTGNILWVTPKEVISTAVLYAVVGLVHVIFRRQFFAAASPFWDFLFYATFGVVVTSSVGMGGVLLVFGYLVIPSVIGILLATSTKNRLLVAWGAGLVMSIMGVLISYHLDLPSGPTIVVLLAVLLALVLVKNQRIADNFNLLSGLAIAFLLLVCLVPFYYSKPEHVHEKKSLVESFSGSKEEILDALNGIKEHPPANLPKEALNLLFSPDDTIREKVIEVIKNGKYFEVQALKKAFDLEEDEFIRIEVAQTLLTLGDSSGLLMLTDLAKSSRADFAREDALKALRDWLTTDLPDEKLLHFVKINHSKFIFDKDEQKYFLKN